MSEPLRIEIAPGESVSALVYPAAARKRAGIALVLAHGAGAGEGAEAVAALVFLGYPLHPPGRPDELRAKHLTDIAAPMLFVQGARDAFGSPGELKPILQRLGASADLYVVENGDHSFKVPKR